MGIRTVVNTTDNQTLEVYRADGENSPFTMSVWDRHEEAGKLPPMRALVAMSCDDIRDLITTLEFHLSKYDIEMELLYYPSDDQTEFLAVNDIARAARALNMTTDAITTAIQNTALTYDLWVFYKRGRAQLERRKKI